MKNKHKKLLLVPLFALLLAGCNRPTPSVDPSVAESSDTTTEEPTSEEPTTEEPTSEEPTSAQSSIDEPTSAQSSIDEPTSKTGPGYEGTENYRKVENGVYSNRELDHAIGMTALNSLGEQKLLVVPVVFADQDDTAVTSSESNHQMLNKLFFGESDDTGWESVASYYHKSSFGKLTITGEVLPYFRLDITTVELGELPNDMKNQQMGEGFYWDKTHHVIERIYNTLDAEKLKEFDLDGDGHVDALWMVYMNHVDALGGGENDPFWAYKFYWNRYPNVEKPTPNVYAWASYQFANEGIDYDYEKPDAHTFIHETGHILSLPDYYDYDGKKSPSGQADMMDYNIADHNIYSKFRLNWAEPYHVTGHADITIKPANKGGEFIIVKDGWNGHAYDEYIAIEYYTPDGLNEKDVTGYRTLSNPSGKRTFSEAGVRIWHVDSRLQKYVYDSATETLVSQDWTNAIEYDDWSFTRIVTSNTGSRAYEGYNLLHLLDAQGYTGNRGNWYKNQALATNTALFKTGDTIAADNWLKYFQSAPNFNDGSPVGYSITIGEMTPEGVQIHIRKA